MTENKKKEQEQIPIKAPKTESTPIKFWKKEGKEKFDLSISADKSGKPLDFIETIKSICGVKDQELALQIFHAGTSALQQIHNELDSFNIILQAMHDIKPGDSVEARFAVQASVLFSHGLSNLKRAETADILCHSEHHSNKAIKLLRLHNETIEALNRYRRGGEQKVTVTHSVIADKAVFNNFNGVRGGNVKNEGASPCQQESAELKPEPTTISHADNPQWQMAGVASMEEKA